MTETKWNIFCLVVSAGAVAAVVIKIYLYAHS